MADAVKCIGSKCSERDAEFVILLGMGEYAPICRSCLLWTIDQSAGECLRENEGVCWEFLPLKRYLQVLEENDFVLDGSEIRPKELSRA